MWEDRHHDAVFFLGERGGGEISRIQIWFGIQYFPRPGRIVFSAVIGMDKSQRGGYLGKEGQDRLDTRHGTGRYTHTTHTAGRTLNLILSYFSISLSLIFIPVYHYFLKTSSAAEGKGKGKKASKQEIRKRREQKRKRQGKAKDKERKRNQETQKPRNTPSLTALTRLTNLEEEREPHGWKSCMLRKEGKERKRALFIFSKYV